MDKKLREARSTLIVSGRAMILLSAWSVVRTLTTFLFQTDSFDFQNEIAELEPLAVFFAYFFVILFLTIPVGIYLFVGFSAIAEGRGKVRGPLYRIVAVILLLLSLISVVALISSWWTDKETLMYLASALLDLSVAIALFDLLKAARTVHRSIPANTP